MASIRLPEAMEARLTALARKTKRSKSYYVKEALITYLEDLEDIAAIEAYRANPHEKGMTTDELLKHLGLPPLKIRRTKH